MSPPQVAAGPLVILARVLRIVMITLKTKRWLTLSMQKDSVNSGRCFANCQIAGLGRK